MKKVIALTTLSIACTLGAQAHAASVEAKQGAVFTTSSIAGAIVGGPVGFILGALGGAYMGEQIEKAENVEQVEWKLIEAEAEIAQLHTELSEAMVKTEEIAQLALDKLEFQVLFHTGADQLTSRGVEKVKALGQYLNENPELSVRLQGHADPRGTDEYNNVLSQHRAQSVQQILESEGVNIERIESHAYGASQSKALKGDSEAYAMERRVDIELFNTTSQQDLAQLN